MIVLELSLRDLSRIKQVDLLVCKYFKNSLYAFCNKYTYDILFLEIIRQVTEDYYYDKLTYFAVNLEDDFEERYYKIENKYSSDSRNVVEKIISLGVNWVIEDVLVHKSKGTFILTGCDNERNLLVNPITNTPDIRYVGEGKSFYVEVCSDFTNFMTKNRRYDIRKLKFYKMSDLILVEKQNIVLLFVDVVNKQYLRIPMKRLLIAYYKEGRTDLIDKYRYNTFAVEFKEEDEFKSLDDLFNSLYKVNNSNIMSYDDNSTNKNINMGIEESIEETKVSEELETEKGFVELPMDTYTPFDSLYPYEESTFGNGPFEDNPF